MQTIVKGRDGRIFHRRNQDNFTDIIQGNTVRLAFVENQSLPLTISLGDLRVGGKVNYKIGTHYKPNTD